MPRKKKEVEVIEQNGAKTVKKKKSFVTRVKIIFAVVSVIWIAAVIAVPLVVKNKYSEPIKKSIVVSMFYDLQRGLVDQYQQLLAGVADAIDLEKPVAFAVDKVRMVGDAVDVVTDTTDKAKDVTADASAATDKVSETTEDELAAMMVGREVNFKVDKKEAKPTSNVLEIKDLVVKDSRKVSVVDGLSLEVKAGEILGIAGIDGNGQSELVEVLTGLRKAESGSIKVNSKELLNKKPKDIFNNGIKNIPEDRHKRGLILDFTVAENTVLQNYKDPRFSKNGILNKAAIEKYADEIIERFDVRPTNHSVKSRALSGGNQQKVIIGREVDNIETARKATGEPQLLIATQPTRGLDVGAIEFVHQALVKQRDEGNAVLLVSLELDEVMNVSDRIAVIYEGKIVGIVDAKNTDENTLGLMMAGGDDNE